MDQVKIRYILILVFLCIAFIGSSQAEEAPIPPEQNWSFNGPLGTWDRASLQRGFQVYKEVCSSCHGMNMINYRNLNALGFSEPEIKAIAAQYIVQDGPNEEGEYIERPALPSDKFVPPYPNSKAARAANNGALPVDLSMVVNARKYGADYVYALLNGYQDPPSGVTLGDNMHYNRYFPGHQIVMTPPLTDGMVEYADGTTASVEQMSRDVVTFLHWAANPKMEDRKEMGIMVLLYMLVFTGFLFVVMKRIWSRVH